MKTLLLLLTVISGHSFAQNAASIKQQFYNGQYEEVIQTLQKLPEPKRFEGKNLIYLSKSLFKTERYKKAYYVYKKLFKRESGRIPLEAYYEFGQINYVLDNLKTAKKYFEKSIKVNYNKLLSLYYIGVMFHSRKKNKTAVHYYNQVIRAKVKSSEDKEVQQGAYAQKAEVLLSSFTKKLGGENFKVKFDENGEIEDYYLLEKQKERIREKVIGTYQKGMEIDPNGNIVSQMKSRIAEITHKYELDSSKMINGRVVRNKNLLLRLNTILGYDSNVVTQSDEAQDQVEDKNSLMGTLRFFTRKKYTYKGRYFIKPELTANYDYYFEDETSDIYNNNQLRLAPALRTTREHSLWGKAASFLFDLEYGYIKRSRDTERKLKHYSRAHGFVIGEQFNYFSFGESTLRLKYRFTDSYDPSIDSNAYTMQFSQFINRENGDRIILVSNFNFLNSKMDSVDSDSYSLIGNYILFPKKSWFTFYSLGMNLTLTDTKELKDSRGIEQMYSPSIAGTKIFSRNMKIEFKYAFTLNESKDDANYSYDKHVVTADFGYTF